MSWPPFTPAEVRARVRGVAIVFVTASVLGFVAAAWVMSIVDGGDAGDRWGASAAYAVSMGLLVASVACLIATSGFVKAVRARFDPSFPWRKDVSELITRGRGDSIADDKRELAARYAAVLAVYLPFQLAQLVLLYIGLAGLQLAALLDGSAGDNAPLRVGIAVLVTLAVVVSVPYSLLQIARVRKYLDANRGLLSA